jgi:group I intron endonuclease
MNLQYKKVPGIYMIKCPANGKFYIGSSTCIYTRWHSHRFLLKNNRHTNIHLQRLVNKRGLESIIFGVIEFVGNDNLIEREQYWFDTLMPDLNICKKAESTLGIKLSDDVRMHLSNIRKGKYPKCINGQNHTAEARKKISEKAKERIKNWGGLHPNFRKASINANTGRKHSDLEIKNRVEQQKKVSPEIAVYIISQRNAGIFQSAIAKELGISQRLVCRVEKGIGVYGTKDYFQAQEKRFKESIAEPLFESVKPEQGKLI